MPRAWLQVEGAVTRHPKVRALAKLYGVEPYLVVGFLVAWWDYCAEFRVCPPDVLTDLAQPLVRCSSLLQVPTVEIALRQVGLAGDTGEPHDWQDYSGQLVTRRQRDAERKRAVRSTSAGHPKDDGHVRRTSAARVEQSRVDKSKTTPERLPRQEVHVGGPNGRAVTVIGNQPNAVLRRFEEVVGYLKAVDTEARQRFSAEQHVTFNVRGVFAYWVTKFSHKRAMLDEQRERTIRKALATNGGNVSELLYAIKAAASDPWAQQDLGRHDVTVLFRDRAHIEKYASRCPAYAKGEPHPFASKLHHTTEDASHESPALP